MLGVITKYNIISTISKGVGKSMEKRLKMFGIGALGGFLIMGIILLSSRATYIEKVDATEYLASSSEIETLQSISQYSLEGEITDVEEDEETINFPFNTYELGDMLIVGHKNRDNECGSKNFNGMTVTINPNIVPYGSIVYIEKLGFRYNQPGDINIDNGICVYFNNEEELQKDSGKNLKSWIVINQENINFKDGDIMADNLGEFHMTSYCPCTICCGQWGGSPEGKIGALGANVYEGVTVAADKSVLSYGSVVYIEGVGIRFINDCGGAINGRDIDVYIADHNRALEFGNYYSNVWVLQ